MAVVLPAPYVITSTDNRGLVVVITGITLSFIWACLLIRTWLRWKLREWKWDDCFLVAATILHTVLAGIVFRIVDAGLGNSLENLSDSSLREIGKEDFGIQILYIITLLLSKYAVLFLYLRLSPQKRHTIASWSTIALSSIWAVVAIPLIATPCNPRELWEEGIEKCAGAKSRMTAVTVIDVITEVIIFAIAIYLVARLNLAMKSKVLVVAAFSTRVPVIAAAATRLIYLQQGLSSADRTLDGSYYMVCTITQLGYAIVSSTLAGLGPLLRPFSQSSGSYVRSTSKPCSGLNRSKMRTQNEHMPGESFQLESMAAHGSRKQQQKSAYRKSTILDPSTSSSSRRSNDNDEPLNLRPDNRELVTRDTAVMGGTHGSIDQDESGSRVSDDDSQHMMITKKTEFTMEMDNTESEGRTWRESDRPLDGNSGRD